MANTAAAWRSMATICIRHKRLDVAEVCLGYMGNILGVRAIREAAELPEADARLAAAAIHLGMIEEAERLYKSCGRYDLLSTLCVSRLPLCIFVTVWSGTYRRGGWTRRWRRVSHATVCTCAPCCSTTLVTRKAAVIWQGRSRRKRRYP
jgi:hypothetical protein